MRTSAEQIVATAGELDVEPHILEKVARLLELLDALAGVPLLRRHVALKGGTALNLFLMDVPQLSVDVDLDLVGAPTRDDLDALRPRIERALEAAFASQDLRVRRRPDAHAGGKWSMRYASVFGQGGELEVDLNVMHRVPLWDPAPLPARLPVFSRRPTVVRDRHELVAGKLAALLDRAAGRDLYDVHALLTGLDLDRRRLRLAFVVAAALSTRDWRRRVPDDVHADPRELRARLLPLLRRTHVPGVRDVDAWIDRLVAETREALTVVLPLEESEQAFLSAVHEEGTIRPEVLTDDEELRDRIGRHPGLLWRALDVRRRGPGAE